MQKEMIIREEEIYYFRRTQDKEKLDDDCQRCKRAAFLTALETVS